MFKPEEQQVEIYLLKSNLQEIENDLVLQRSALPALDAENDQKYRETITALRENSALNAEIERLKLENARLTAKRMQLKRQSDDISKSIEKYRASRSELTELLKQEEQKIEHQIREYEDTLAEIAERFRETRGSYNKEEITAQTNKVEVVNTELEDEIQKRQSIVGELAQQLDMLTPDIPEDLLIIVGKEELDTQTKELTEKYDALIQKRNLIINKKNV